jgi:hypothetical protein
LGGGDGFMTGGGGILFGGGERFEGGLLVDSAPPAVGVC